MLVQGTLGTVAQITGTFWGAARAGPQMLPPEAGREVPLLIAKGGDTNSARGDAH